MRTSRHSTQKWSRWALELVLLREGTRSGRERFGDNIQNHNTGGWPADDWLANGPYVQAAGPMPAPHGFLLPYRGMNRGSALKLAAPILSKARSSSRIRMRSSMALIAEKKIAVKYAPHITGTVKISTATTA